MLLFDCPVFNNSKPKNSLIFINNKNDISIITNMTFLNKIIIIIKFSIVLLLMNILNNNLIVKMIYYFCQIKIKAE